MSSRILGLLRCQQGVLCPFNAFKCPILVTACPSIWGMKCLTFTKLLSRETTTTCLSDRVPDCKDRLSSKPNSHSGNAVTCRCCSVVVVVILLNQKQELLGIFLFCLVFWQLSLHSISPRRPLIPNNNRTLLSGSIQKCTLCCKSLDHLVQAAQVSSTNNYVSFLAPPSPPGCSIFSDHMGLVGH